MKSENFVCRKNCPICESSELKPILSQPFSDEPLWQYITMFYKDSALKSDWEGGSFEINYCSACNFYFSKYPPTEKFEEQIIKRSEKVGRLPIREQKMGLQHYSRLAFECERISSLLQKIPNEISVLEFGSGFGHWLLMAKAFNYKTCGIEIHEDRVTYSESNSLKIYRSLNEVNDSSFDFIFSNQVFEHLNEPSPALKHLVTKLKTRGIIQIGVPEGNKIKKIIKTYDGTPNKLIGPIGHVNGFTNQALVALAQKSGLTLLTPAVLRKRYLKTMVQNRDLKYLREILLAGYKQRHSCYLYFEKS